MVLILIVVDNGLVHHFNMTIPQLVRAVLILIVVDNGLVLSQFVINAVSAVGS